MNLWENARLAWSGLLANKMRSLLTMLGIIIGIASVIAILTVGDGMTNSVYSSMGSLGANNIKVYLQVKEQPDGSYVYPDNYADSYITDEMLQALRDRYSGAITNIATYQSMDSGKVQRGEDYANVNMMGINEDLLATQSLELVAGRNIMARDMERARHVAIVSDKLVNNMFGGDINGALGQEVVVYTSQSGIYSFTVVGVYRYENSGGMGASTASEKDISTNLFIPISTAKRLTHAEPGYDDMLLTTAQGVDNITFTDQILSFLNQYYVNDQYFQVAAYSMESMLEQLNSMLGTITLALSVIAGISLLVGGIGVMNIMLVSVTERTREIGTRKALGATNNQIRAQFVVESMIICLIGGGIGILLGGTLGYAGSSLLQMPSLPGISSIAVSVGFSLGIGLFFGYYPANKAAKLDPIEALRYE